MQTSNEDRYLFTQGDLENRLAVLMGGRAAELLIFGDISTGAADDLQRATELARAMVMRYGMDQSVGPMAMANERVPLLQVSGLPAAKPELSDATASAIDAGARRILEQAQIAGRFDLAQQDRLPQGLGRATARARDTGCRRSGSSQSDARSNCPENCSRGRQPYAGGSLNSGPEHLLEFEARRKSGIIQSKR